MKKLFILLTFTLLSVSLIGQTIGMGGVADYFCEKPRHEQMIIMFDNPFDKETYWFVANGDTFMVSYEPYLGDINDIRWGDNEKRVRNLYLYRLDSDGCKIAVDKPLRVDYKWNVDEGSILCNYYYPRLNKGGSVELKNDGTIVIYLTVMYNTVSERSKTFFNTESIFLTPINNKTYQVNAKGSPVYSDKRQ